MPSHIPPSASKSLEHHSSNHMQQELLSKWVIAQPAYEVTTSAVGNRDIDLSPDQIDTILAIRKRIASAQQSHD